MCVLALEFLRIGTAVWVGCAISIAFKSDRRHCDHGTFSKPLFKLVILPLAFGQAQSPAVIVDDDTDMVRVIKGGSAPLERRIVEAPLRRCELPDELVEIMPVFFVAGASAFRRKVKLVPPFELSLWRQGHLIRFNAADQITAHGDKCLATFRPQRRDDVCCPGAPIKPSEDRLLNLESIHQSDGIESKCRLLAIAERFTRKKPCGAIAAHKRNNYFVARRRQQRGNIDIAVNVVRPAVQKDDRAAVGGAGFSVSHIEKSGIDLL